MKLPEEIIEDVETALGLIKSDTSAIFLRAAAYLLEGEAKRIREHLNAAEAKTRKPQLGLRLSR